MKKIKKFWLFLFILCAIICPMGLFTWGSLPKAQDNAQTIDEAIQSAIVAHEEDPTAHLGDGESLQAHKSNEIIDHPASSILADKANDNELTLDIFFQSMDSFAYSGSVYVDQLRLWIYIEPNVVENSHMYFELFNETEFSTTKYSLLFQTLCRWYSSGDTTANLSFGRIGFEIENGRIRGYSYINSTQTKTYTAWYTVDMTELHSLRAQYSKNDNIVYFIIDGNTFGTLEDIFTPINDVLSFYADVNAGTVTDNSLLLYNLKVSAYEKD